MGIQKLELRSGSKSHVLSLFSVGLGSFAIFGSSLLVQAECSGRHKATCELLHSFDPVVEQGLWLLFGVLFILGGGFAAIRDLSLGWLVSLESDGLRFGWSDRELIGWHEILSLRATKYMLNVEFTAPRETVSYLGKCKTRRKLSVPIYGSNAYLDGNYQWEGAKSALETWISNKQAAERDALSQV